MPTTLPKWAVRQVTWLPVALRPGVLLALIVAIAWLVFVRPRAPALWHASCRLVARGTEFVVGLVVLPDYIIASSRRRRDATVAVGPTVLDRGTRPVLSRADAVYERHRRDPLRLSALPWPLLLAIVAIFASAWLVMDHLPVTTPFRHELSNVFQYWRDVEDWAQVPPDRRAASGWYPPLPQVERLRRHGREVAISVRCPEKQSCAARVAVDGSRGTLTARRIGIPPSRQRTVKLRLPRDAARQPIRVALSPSGT